MANPKVKIKIDEDKVHVSAGIHPVTDLKGLTTPPVPADHTLSIDRRRRTKHRDPERGHH